MASGNFCPPPMMFQNVYTPKISNLFILRKRNPKRSEENNKPFRKRKKMKKSIIKLKEINTQK